ncbi:hypothetical protein ACHAXT_009974 [Thalassiosira profunda]
MKCCCCGPDAVPPSRLDQYLKKVGGPPPTDVPTVPLPMVLCRNERCGRAQNLTCAMWFVDRVLGALPKAVSSEHQWTQELLPTYERYRKGVYPRNHVEVSHCISCSLTPRARELRCTQKVVRLVHRTKSLRPFLHRAKEKSILRPGLALFSGYAPDGGLLVPASLPTIDGDDLRLWSTLSYAELACTVLRMFVSPAEIDDEDIKRICDASYRADEFDDDAFVPVKSLGSAFIAELFHGPTFCFKDMGMRPVIRLLSHFATKRNKPTTLLVSTTGDTGPAAVHAVSDVANPLLTILVHYPNGQISDFQRRQLTTVDSGCVKIASFEGGGDDMDWPIKQTLLINSNSDECGERTFCGINSYNIGRPLVQMVHFIWIYLRTAELLGIEPGDKDRRIDMVIPTGAMGNLTGGYMAKQMGVPIGMLCAGVNINDITHRVMERGEFHRRKIKQTLSDAINIEVPYNFERIAFYVTEGNHALIKDWMTTMERTQQLTLEATWLEKLKADFRSARVTDDEMCSALRQVQRELHYVADPHTAVAIASAQKLGYDLTAEAAAKNGTQVVILATASPCKFEKVVTLALGEQGWKEWEANSFPTRARATLGQRENKPYHYAYREGASLNDVQTEWRNEMLKIVDDNF